MNKSLHANLKSPTRGMKARNRYLTNRFLPFLIMLAAYFGFQHDLVAQTTTITTENGTGFDGTNSAGTNSFITFVVENTNTYDIILSGVDQYWLVADNGAVANLWYTATSLSGAVNITTPTWTNISSGTVVSVPATGYQPTLTNLNFIIPAGTQYRFALHTNKTLAYSGTTTARPTPNIISGGGVNLKVDNAQIAGGPVGASGVFPTSSNLPRAFTGRIHFYPALPCVAPPTGGQAVSTVATVCPNTNFKLSLTGASGGMGMTYQWQSSANGTTGWTNIPGATGTTNQNAPYTASQTTTTWYRAVLTCSGQTANSLPVQVTTNATPVTGTFTINKGAPATATNFQSFAAAIASIECGGAGGPITFNVVTGSGPYNEQVVVPVIPGTSATNTVTFNGNGNTIAAAPTGANHGVITIDGADYIKFDNFIVNVDAATTTGAGIQLMNDADNATLSNNTVNIPHSITSSLVNGIFSGTTATTASNSTSNSKIQNNTVNGGYYGIRLNGNASGTGALNNEITGNTIKEFYTYGIYLNNTDGTLIQANDITRPARTNPSTFYGTYITGATKSTMINRNRYHNAFGGTPSSTGTAYVIYYGSVDAPAGSENIAKNNLIYDINTNGLIYALYSLGSDGAYYFHNTIDLTEANSTGTVRGFFQTTAATNVKFQNNIITIAGGLSGAKHAMYFGTTTSTITSNNNVLYATGGADIGYFSADRATLADWRTASSQDANSVSANPMYVNLATGDLKPTNSTVNGIGAALTPPVTDDITGATRSTTAPDPGAYEFTPAANDAGITAIISPTTPVTPGISQPIQVTIKNYGLSTLTSATITATITGTATQTITYNWTGSLANNATANATIGNFTFPTGNYTINVCTSQPNAVVDANPGNDCFSTPIISCTALTGTYTINKNIPTAGTNFQSLSDAAARVSSCGITGPVIFNVVTGTGPYNEQLILGSISGTSATNTVTFNGNGNTISATPAGINQGIVTFKGADFVKVDNFILTLDANVTAGWGVQLTDEANNNTISNNTINLPVSSTSSTLVGIASGTTISTAGNNASNNKIQNNTINGGYYGIRLNGTTGGTGASNNEITGNTIKDVYIYNMYLMDTEGTLIQGNDISQPTRTTFTTFYGIYLTGSAKNTIISKNRIHNAYENATSSTSTAYIIYLSSVDAPAGSENIIKNNLIYDIKTNGTIYGFYNAGSDGAYYYYNTVVLDHPSNTGTVRGFYQTTSATNIKIMNNIFSINGTSGTKHALYFGTAASTIQSNYNDLYVQNGSVGYYSTDFPTLTLWKTANTNAYDQASISADPIFSNPATGDFRPTSVAVNNLGTPIPAVTDDILGNPRSATTPDMGAYEFSLNPNDVGITAITGPVSGCGLTAAQAITVTIKNFGTSTQTSVPVSLFLNGVNLTPTPETWTGTLAPNATANHTFTATTNLGAAGQYTIVGRTGLTGDSNTGNDSDTLVVTNALMAGLPVINFETAATGLNALRQVTNSKSNITENAAASLPLFGQPATSTKGMVMEGTTATGWVLPGGLADPWTMNPDHLSGVYMCFDPQGAANPTTPLWLAFDLKQTFKTASVNTNFRVTIDGVQVGPTYRPPFTGTPIEWQKIYVDLTPYMNQGTIQIGLESSVSEPYANGAGPANLIDNLRVVRFDPTGVKDKVFQNSINVYPNPSNGVFSVSVPNAKAYTLEVTDLTGRMIKTETVKGNAKLDLSGNSQGVYLLKISSEGASAVQKLIIE